MITLTDIRGSKILLSADDIRQVTVAGASQAWHGARSNVRTLDGQWIEVCETIDEIQERVRADQGGAA